MKSNHLASCLLGALALSACNNDTPLGSLTVPFQIGTNNVCSYKNPSDEDVPVSSVRVSLYRKGTLDMAEPVAVADAPCADGEVLFEDVTAGNYNVVAEGINGDGLVVFDNGSSAAEDFAEVLEGQDILAESVRLTLTPVKVLLRWKFGFGNNQCTQIPMSSLELTTLRDDGNAELGPGGSFACEDDDIDADGYHRLVDDTRALNGNDLDTIEIAPKDMAGATIGDLAIFQFPERGPGATVKLTIEITCTDTACDLACSGTPCAPDA